MAEGLSATITLNVNLIDKEFSSFAKQLGSNLDRLSAQLSELKASARGLTGGTGGAKGGGSTADSTKEFKSSTQDISSNLNNTATAAKGLSADIKALERAIEQNTSAVRQGAASSRQQAAAGGGGRAGGGGGTPTGGGGGGIPGGPPQGRAIKGAFGFGEQFSSVAKFAATAKLVQAGFEAFGKGMRTIVEVNAEMAELNKVLGTTQANLNKLQSAAISTGKEMGQSVTKVLQGFKIFAQQGLGPEQVAERGRIVALGANLGDLNTEELSETVTAGLNVFGDELQGSAESLIDSFVEVETLNAVTMKDLSEVMKRVGTAAKVAGVSIHELNALATVIQERTRQGGERTGTSLRFILKQLFDPRSEASLASIGVSTTDATGNLRSAFDVLKDLSQVFPTLTDRQKRNVGATIAQTRFYNTFLGLMEGFPKTAEIVEQSQNAQGTASERNAILMQSVSKQMEKTKVAFEGFAVALGEGLTGPINTTLRAAQSLLETLTSIANIKLPGSKALQMITGTAPSEAQGISLGAVGGTALAAGGAVAAVKVISVLAQSFMKMVGVSAAVATTLGGVASAGAPAIGLFARLAAAASVLVRSLTPWGAAITALSLALPLLGRAFESTTESLQRRGITPARTEAKETLQSSQRLSSTIDSISSRLKDLGTKGPSMTQEQRDQSRKVLSEGIKPIIDELRTTIIKQNLGGTAGIQIDEKNNLLFKGKPLEGLEDIEAIDAVNDLVSSLANLRLASLDASNAVANFPDRLKTLKETGGDAGLLVSSIENLQKTGIFEKGEFVKLVTGDFRGKRGELAVPRERFEQLGGDRKAAEALFKEQGKQLFENLRVEEVSGLSAAQTELFRPDPKARKRLNEAQAEIFQQVDQAVSRGIRGGPDAMARVKKNLIEEFKGLNQKDFNEAILASFGAEAKDAGEERLSKIREREFSKNLSKEEADSRRVSLLMENRIKDAIGEFDLQLGDMGKLTEKGEFRPDITLKEGVERDPEQVVKVLKSLKEGALVQIEDQGTVSQAKVFKDVNDNLTLMSKIVEVSGKTVTEGRQQVVSIDTTSLESIIKEGTTGIQVFLSTGLTQATELIVANLARTGFGAGQAVLGPDFNRGADSLSQMSDQVAGTFTEFSKDGPQFNQGLRQVLIRAAEIQKGRAEVTKEGFDTNKKVTRGFKDLATAERNQEASFAILDKAVSSMGVVVKAFDSAVQNFGKFTARRAAEEAIPLSVVDARRQFGGNIPQVQLPKTLEQLAPLERAALSLPNAVKSLSAGQQQIRELQGVRATAEEQLQSIDTFLHGQTTDVLTSTDPKILERAIKEGFKEFSEEQILDITEQISKTGTNLGTREEAMQNIRQVLVENIMQMVKGIETEGSRIAKALAPLEVAIRAAEAVSQLATSAEQAAQDLRRNLTFDERLGNLREAAGQGPGAALGSRAPIAFTLEAGQTKDLANQINLSGLNEFEAERKLINLRASGRTVLDQSRTAMQPLSAEGRRAALKDVDIREAQATRRVGEETTSRAMSEFRNNLIGQLKNIDRVIESGTLTKESAVSLRNLQNEILQQERKPVSDFVDRAGNVRPGAFSILDEIPKQLRAALPSDITKLAPGLDMQSLNALRTAGVLSGEQSAAIRQEQSKMELDPAVQAIDRGTAVSQQIADNTAIIAGKQPGAVPSTTPAGTGPELATVAKNSAGAGAGALIGMQASADKAVEDTKKEIKNDIGPIIPPYKMSDLPPLLPPPMGRSATTGISKSAFGRRDALGESSLGGNDLASRVSMSIPGGFQTGQPEGRLLDFASVAQREAFIASRGQFTAGIVPSTAEVKPETLEDIERRFNREQVSSGIFEAIKGGGNLITPLDNRKQERLLNAQEEQTELQKTSTTIQQDQVKQEPNKELPVDSEAIKEATREGVAQGMKEGSQSLSEVVSSIGDAISSSFTSVISKLQETMGSRGTAGGQTPNIEDLVNNVINPLTASIGDVQVDIEMVKARVEDINSRLQTSSESANTAMSRSEYNFTEITNTTNRVNLLESELATVQANLSVVFTLSNNR